MPKYQIAYLPPEQLVIPGSLPNQRLTRAQKRNLESASTNQLDSQGMSASSSEGDEKKRKLDSTESTSKSNFNNADAESIPTYPVASLGQENTRCNTVLTNDVADAIPVQEPQLPPPMTPPMMQAIVSQPGSKRFSFTFYSPVVPTRLDLEEVTDDDLANWMNGVFK